MGCRSYEAVREGEGEDGSWVLEVLVGFENGVEPEFGRAGGRGYGEIVGVGQQTRGGNVGTGKRFDIIFCARSGE